LRDTIQGKKSTVVIVSMNAKITWTADYQDRSNFIFGGSIPINYSPKELWNLLASPGHLMKVHPLCEKHETEKWDGIGSKDIVIYKDGGKRIRTVLQWNVEQFIQLQVEDLTGTNKSLVSYTIKKLPEKNNCELLIQIQTSSYKNIPRIYWKFYARIFLFPQYKKYLQGVLSGFANYKP